MRGPRLLAVALVFAVAVAALPVGRAQAAQRSSPVTAATGGALYTFNSGAPGFFTKTYFYDTGEEVVAFDAQFTPDLAQAAIDWVGQQTDSPVTHLVITHPNPDKFNGLAAFQDAGAEVVASEATAAAMPGVHEYKQAFFVGAGMFTEATYPALGTVDYAFRDAMSLELNSGKTVELSELSQPGVSSTQTVAFIPEMNALVVGDLVHHGTHAWLEGGIVDGQATPTIDGWIADLRELADAFAGDPEPTVYGGRGNPAPLADAVAAQIAYLQTADRIVTDYVDSLGARVSELRGDQAGEHYAAIQAAIAAAVPDYGFPDMIGFSVYGLVNSKL